MFSKVSMFAAWFVADPRRAVLVLFVILVALMMISMFVSGAQVLAGDITSTN
jgi:hypothetical protein